MTAHYRLLFEYLTLITEWNTIHYNVFLVIIYAHLNAVIKSTKWVIIQSTI